MPELTRKQIFPLLLLIALQQGCSLQSSDAIHGRIALTGDTKTKVYLILPRFYRELAADYQGLVIDSADIAADGSFHFDDHALPPARSILLLAIQSPGSRFANHLVDENPSSANYMPVLYVPGESISVSAEGKMFHQTFAFHNGSTWNQQLITLRDLRITGYDDYQQKVRGMQADSLIMEKEKAHLDYIRPLMHFADTTAVDEAALLALRWISPTNDFERIPEFISHQCDRLQRGSDSHPFAAEVCAIADPQHLALRTGDTVPDFAMPMSNGDTVDLHTILGKKLTILDLWASWCAPCRIENRKVLSPLYQQYRDAGMEIIGYALESEADPWQAAILKDKAVWLHASHLTGDSSPLMDAFRITTIPANYILNADGKILAKNLHGEELEEWLRSFFK